MATVESLGSTYFDLIATVNRVRRTIHGLQNGTLLQKDFELIQEALTPYKNFQTVTIFLQDCENSINRTANFSATRNFVFEKKEPIVISFFDVPYNASLGFDAFVYELEMPDEFFVEKYKASMASTVNIKACTDGFDQYPTCVALFPENFCATEAIKNKFSVFYFLNVFVRRFEEYGRPVLQKFVSQGSFWRLKRLSKPELLKSFATWHYLHEYFHSTGYLPLADYFKVKNTKSTAALEELRVDALSILECIENAQNGYTDAYYYAELILFERLLRYSAHLNPNENYDARSSLIFLKYLEEQQAIKIDENYTLDIQKAKLKTGLSNYVNNLSEIEKRIKYNLSNESTSEDIRMERQSLNVFAQKYIGTGEIIQNAYLQRLYDNSMMNVENIHV